MTGRSDVWLPIWTDRDADRADWNGLEACFESFEVYLQWCEKIADLVSAELDLGPDDVVVDLGCGTGRLASLLAPRVRRVIAIDYSATVLDVARERRPSPRVEYRQADLNHLDLASMEGVTKAYTMGVFYYLDSLDRVREILQGLAERDVKVAVIDLPDATMEDTHERSYDREVYSHLQFDRNEMLSWVPGSEVKQHSFPEYVHSGYRFNYFVR